jgi:hypothetical protein
MKVLLAMLAAALWFLLAAAAPPASEPSPIPSINLNPPAGPPGTVVAVTGTQFSPGKPVTLYWDATDRVLASAKADGSGNLNATFQVPDDKVGSHIVGVVQPPQPTAQFNVEPKPTPSPTPSPSPVDSPSTAAASPSAAGQSPSPLNPGPTGSTHVNGLSLLFQPPFVFFPLLLALAVVVALGIWVRGMMRRPEPEPDANVSHHRVRQQADYQPADDVELPPAPGFLRPWPPSPEPPQEPKVDPPQASPEPPHAPPPPAPGSDEPPEMPEPGD